MKILVVCQCYYPDQFRVNDICETLAQRGHDVTVLTGLPNYPHGKILPEYRWPKGRREVISGVNIIRVPLVGRGNNLFSLSMNYLSFALTSSIKALFLEKDFDVVFVYQLSPVTMALPALFYKKIAKKNVLLYCLDIWPESLVAGGIGHDSLIYKVLLAISHKIYKTVDSIAVSSQSFIDYIKNIVGVKNQDFLYLPQYAEELFSINQSEELIDHKKRVDLLFAGNIGEMQSVETIVRAAAELKDIPNLMWHIVGDGSSREKCQELAKKLGLEDKVRFYGQRPVTDMPKLYSKATALLITLKDNSFISYTLPGKLQSYLAAGRPIIGAIGGEARKVIEESNCGLCCDPEDHIRLAELVKRFVSEPEKHQAYTLNGRLYYEKYFNKDIFINHLIDKLAELAG